MTTSRCFAVMLLAGVLGVSCGDDDGGGSTSRSGLDPDKTRGELTAADIDQLCAWGISQIPAMLPECDGGPVTPITMSMCVASINLAPRTCPATVRDVEDCVLAAVTDICTSILSIPQCAPVIMCGSATDAGP